MTCFVTGPRPGRSGLRVSITNEVGNQGLEKTRTPKRSSVRSETEHYEGVRQDREPKSGPEFRGSVGLSLVGALTHVRTAGSRA
jgi:hypothetical protein